MREPRRQIFYESGRNICSSVRGVAKLTFFLFEAFIVTALAVVLYEEYLYHRWILLWDGDRHMPNF
jgi:hypothetical protein